MTKKKKEIHKGVFLQLIGGNVLFDIADDALISDLVELDFLSISMDRQIVGDGTVAIDSECEFEESFAQFRGTTVQVASKGIQGHIPLNVKHEGLSCLVWVFFLRCSSY